MTLTQNETSVTGTGQAVWSGTAVSGPVTYNIIGTFSDPNISVSLSGGTIAESFVGQVTGGTMSGTLDGGFGFAVLSVALTRH